MSDFIQDGTGTGFRAKVTSDNKIAADAISTTAATEAVLKGDLYNFNTGIVTLTSDSASSLLYLKNEEVTANYLITRAFYNLSASTGGSGDLLIDLVKNPSQGTLISAGTVNSPINLNFGSSKILQATVLQGTEGSSVTDGSNALSTLASSAGTRILITIDSLILTPGSSIAIRITPQTGNTDMRVQVGFNLYRKEPE